MAYWLFQSNPKYYRILDAIQDLEQMPCLMLLFFKFLLFHLRIMI
jgi:hypothetical protein